MAVALVRRLYKKILLLLILLLLVTVAIRMQQATQKASEAAAVRKHITIPQGSSRTERPSYPKRKAPKLLIFTYSGSESCVVGQLFSKHTGAFYLSEPLDMKYSEMFGTATGWNVPTDITHFRNGSRRQQTNKELLQVSEYLDDLYNCRMDKLPLVSRIHGYWSRTAKENGLTVGPFVHCLEKTGIDRRSFDKCHDQITGVCGKRIGESPDFLDCGRTQQNDTELPGGTGKDAMAYRACVHAAAKKSASCNGVLYTACKKAPFHVIKTIRLSMTAVEYLLERNKDLTVLHFLRDPRAMMLKNSYLLDHSSLYAQGRFSKKRKAQIMDVVKEARLYCDTVARDISVRMRLEQKYPQRTLQVIHEAFIRNQRENIRRIYDFIGVKVVPKKVNDWTRAGVFHASCSQRTSSVWTKTLTYKEALGIELQCADFFDMVKFPWL